MEESLKNYARQFEYEPVIEGGDLPKAKNIIVGGMGGSHLVADLLKYLRPGLRLTIHEDYGLPAIIEPETLAVAFSYSGNTEETISFAESALMGGLPVVIIATGGKLIELARGRKIPYIQMPSDKVGQPRLALVLGLRALAKALGDDDLSREISDVAQTFNPAVLEAEATKIAGELHGKIPIIWSSRAAEIFSYNWKIRINETAKIPAFANVFPELNHNEMSGFGTMPKDFNPEMFYFLIIADEFDSRIMEIRMEKTLEVLGESGLHVRILRFSGKSPLERALNTIVTADWVALKLAQKYGANPDGVPLVEKFKKLLDK